MLVEDEPVGLKARIAGQDGQLSLVSKKRGPRDGEGGGK